MKVLIRKAAREDAKQIAIVHVDSWRTTYKGIVADSFLNSLTYESKEKIWRSINPDTVFVAEDEEGKIVGFAGFGPSRSQEFGYDGELYAIYLLKEAQGAGVGKRLVRAAAEELMNLNYQTMMLWVMNANPSKGFYERYSPEKVGEDTYAIEGTDHPETAYGWNLKDLSARLNT
ncbi:GNAT family N-acetyltransferase [Metabacillus indicus]|uniref:GNAT family N-acetyltransferase n=1 Tax=Metabacillus indicus TaxID=246786 RepID=UPI0039840304